MPIQCTCVVCGAAFAVRPSARRGGQGRFCSLQCYGRHLANGPDEFWAQVDRSGGCEACWPWVGAMRENGYGFFNYQNRQIAAHRFAFFLTHGRLPMPEGCHHCDNRACCNPAHIFEGTQLDNMHDMIAKGRQGPTWTKENCPDRQGSANPHARLTDDQVITIRRLHCEGVSYRLIANQFGLSKGNISDIIHRRRWGHI